MTTSNFIKQNNLSQKIDWEEQTSIRLF